MQTKKWLAAAVLAAVGGLPLHAHAQYAGVTETPAVVPVSSILKDAEDDQEVALRGKILRKAGGEDDKYVFADATGEIVVEIDDDEFPADPIDQNTRVEIRGEVDTDRDRPPKIDVESVRVLND